MCECIDKIMDNLYKQLLREIFKAWKCLKLEIGLDTIEYVYVFAGYAKLFLESILDALRRILWKKVC